MHMYASQILKIQAWYVRQVGTCSAFASGMKSLPKEIKLCNKIETNIFS